MGPRRRWRVSPCALKASLSRPRPGGASLAPGSLEVMLHRRTVHDDWRGVGEPISETECPCTGKDCGNNGGGSDASCPGLTARGVHELSLAPPASAAAARRGAWARLNDPPLLAFSAPGGDYTQGSDNYPRLLADRHAPALGSGGGGNDGKGRGGGGRDGDHAAPAVRRPTFSALPAATAAGGDLLGNVRRQPQGGLPANVHLLTLQQLAPGKLLVRLAHAYQVPLMRGCFPCVCVCVCVRVRAYKMFNLRLCILVAGPLVIAGQLPTPPPPTTQPRTRTHTHTRAGRRGLRAQPVGARVPPSARRPAPRRLGTDPFGVRAVAVGQQAPGRRRAAPPPALFGRGGAGGAAGHARV